MAKSNKEMISAILIMSAEMGKAIPETEGLDSKEIKALYDEVTEAKRLRGVDKREKGHYVCQGCSISVSVDNGPGILSQGEKVPPDLVDEKALDRLLQLKKVEYVS